jgi:hypothetical protein
VTSEPFLDDGMNEVRGSRRCHSLSIVCGVVVEFYVSFMLLELYVDDRLAERGP